jgi:PAS domain S-box-containing protein
MGLSKRKLAWGAFSIALILLVIIGVASYRTTNRLVESQELIAHTHQVQTYVEDLRSDLIEAGYARRGYLISGDESFVTRYQGAVDDVPVKMQQVRDMTRDNKAQQTRLAELQSVVTEDLELLKKSIALRKGGGIDLDEQRALTQQSAALEARASAIVFGMRAEESRLLHERQSSSNRIFTHALRIVGAGFLFALLLLAAEFYLFDRELTQHQQTEKRARRSRELLNAFFSSSTVGFAILDSELCCKRANSVLATMAGIDPASLPGRPLSELFGTLGQKTEMTLCNLMESGEPVLDHEISGLIAGRAGEKRHWLVNYFPIREESGRVTQIGMIALDVTGKARAEEAIRRLSGRLIRLQDQERRRIARELHDSLGQYLASLKLTIDVLANAPQDRRGSLLAEASTLAQDCITETRTVSHLLHPPLLDEMGLSSAARWFVNGFADRSGVRIALDAPENLPRLPDAVEITLFRVLQEGLTNVHRHSHSPSAEIALKIIGDNVVLRIRDHGEGISRAKLEQYQKDGTNVGVGLIGMRERVREQGGEFEIQSSAQGTLLTVTIPLPARVETWSHAEPGAA